MCGSRSLKYRCHFNIGSSTSLSLGKRDLSVIISVSALIKTIMIYSPSFRFGQLLCKDTIAICIEKEDPLLTSTVLSLFTLLVRSEDVVKMLCGHGDPDPCGHGDLDPCALLTCYQCLLDPPSSPSSPSPSEGKDDASCKIQIQV